MKSIVAVLALSSAAAVSAHRYPANYCVVDLNGTPYTELSLRPTPCNNRKPIMMLPNGLPVKDVNAPPKYGCGYWYKKVAVKATDGKDYYGYVGTDYISCGSRPAPVPPMPPTPPRPQPVYQQKCGSFCVKNGGPTNCCGANQYTAGDYDMCNADGSNCQATCCSPNGPIVYST